MIFRGSKTIETMTAIRNALEAKAALRKGWGDRRQEWLHSEKQRALLWAAIAHLDKTIEALDAFDSEQP